MADDPQKVALRGRIVGLFQGGLSIREISRQVGVSPSTVLKWTARHENGEPLTDKPRSGRPRSTTLEEDLQMVNAAILNPISKRGATGISEEVSKMVIVLFKLVQGDRNPIEKYCHNGKHSFRLFFFRGYFKAVTLFQH